MSRRRVSDLNDYRKWMRDVYNNQHPYGACFQMTPEDINFYFEGQSPWDIVGMFCSSEHFDLSDDVVVIDELGNVRSYRDEESLPIEWADDMDSRTASTHHVEWSGGTVKWVFYSNTWNDPSADGFFGTPCLEVSGHVDDAFGGSTGFVFTVFYGDSPNEYYADLELSNGYICNRQFSTERIPATDGFEDMLVKVFGDVVTP